MAIHGTDDFVVSYATGVDAYEAANAPKYFLTLEGGGHLGFSRVAPSIVEMTDDRHEQLSRTATTAFLMSLFAEDQAFRNAAKQYLEEGYNEENGIDSSLEFEF